MDGRIRLGYIEAALLDSAIPSFHNDEPTYTVLEPQSPRRGPATTFELLPV